MSESTGGNGSAKRSNDDPADSGNAKRSKGVGGSSSGHHEAKIEVRLLIPLSTAGAIIGKGGSNIRDMRQEFNANIQIPDSQGVERVITVTTRTISDSAKILGRIVSVLNERMKFENYGSVRILVHKSQAGTIIGLKGSRIKELRESTGANIKVNQECCPDSTDRICQIRGSVDVIIKASEIIIEMLQHAQPKGAVFNYDPNFFDDSYDYGGYNSFDKDFGEQASRGGRMRRGGMRGRGMGRGQVNRSRGRDAGFENRNFGGRGGNFGGFDEENYNEGGFDPSGNEFNPQISYADDNVEGEQTTQVTIPTSLAGAIIGKGGQRIKQIRIDSGATIKIDEAAPGCDDRIITITGTKDQTQNAQYLLQKSVKLFAGERF